MEPVISGRDSREGVFTDSVFDQLETILVLIVLLGGRRSFFQVLDLLTVYMTFLDKAAVEAKASQEFHDIWFTLL